MVDNVVDPIVLYIDAGYVQPNSLRLWSRLCDEPVNAPGQRP